ncbi:hypothetical protein BC351_03920 [Paenibacillus ferrarius]|uniref:DUF2187 domain-containing protein n=1 Tax=Paenibacillus ferrarius TaxID=1469647 RepID=A0A1V4HK89_9BACL|nr:hypothetical protein [Paenibacillus ferrarius]OPH57671.1 hypothetical protein BC351_03920 [Paenibacillus ferrarius]
MTDTVKLSIGGTYIFAPDNPRKTKNRGRRCTILSFEFDQNTNQVEVRIVYHDTNRQTSVEISDLKPIDEAAD